jgi:hypothetical protein
MNYQLQTDQQILESIGIALEAIRIQKGLQDADIISVGGVTKDALNKFKKGQNITTLNLIKIFRGAGLLDALAGVMQVKDETPLFAPAPKAKPKRIVKKKKKPALTWGDEK